MAGSLIAVSLAARGVAAQAVDQRPPPQAAPAGAQARPPVAVPQATQWWCEINAQPAAALRTAAPIGVPATKEDVGQSFFMSQIFSRSARADEQKTVDRICRRSFEVQFGMRWDLITGRAQQAPTVEGAKARRDADAHTGAHLGRTQNFRVSGTG
jgi:hypothetical protein